MNALTTTTPAEAFRSKASGLLIDVATMTLHELVDEFQRLTAVIDANLIFEAEASHRYPSFNPTAELASRERKLVVGAARARFGLSFEAYDRASSNADSDF